MSAFPSSNLSDPDYDPSLHAGHEAYLSRGLCSHPSHAATDEPTTAAGRAMVAYLAGPVDCDEHDTPEWVPRWNEEVARIEAEARREGAADALAAVERAREALAALEHEQWEAWSREVAATGLTPERIERWQRYWVPYDDLAEDVKDHDRKWADRVLAAIEAERKKAAETA